jgi:hypothetical protein
MSEQDQARGRNDADDVEGHVNYRGSGDQLKVDDAEGHLWRRGDDGDDTGEHIKAHGGDDRDDTEGHVRARGDDDGDDVEGHYRR